MACGLGACRAPESPGWTAPGIGPEGTQAQDSPSPSAPVRSDPLGIPPATETAKPSSGLAATPASLDVLRDARASDETAPERFTVRFETTRGPLHLDVRRSWAPYGADRFYTLVKRGFFEDVAFFRVVQGFAAQIGLHGDSGVNAVWRNRRIPDDPVTQSNVRGMLSFGTHGKDSRTTQVFINLADNPNLDAMGFAPIGRVRELDVIDSLYAGYGEAAPGGRGPNQGRIQREGNAYLRADFPKLDYIQHATLMDEHRVRTQPAEVPARENVKHN